MINLESEGNAEVIKWEIGDRTLVFKESYVKPVLGIHKENGKYHDLKDLRLKSKKS